MEGQTISGSGGNSCVLNQFRTSTKPRCCKIYSIFSLKYTRLSQKRHYLDDSICCSQTCIYLSALIIPVQMCKLPVPLSLMHLHSIRYAGLWSDSKRPDGPSLLYSRRGSVHALPTLVSNFDSSGHRTIQINCNLCKLCSHTEKCCWAHAMISMTESCCFLMKHCLNDQKLSDSNTGFQSCTDIYLYFWELLLL